MSDWAGACIIDGFPKENMTYYIQFINEPKIVPKKSQYGKDYKMAQIALQFFAVDEFGKHHYMDWDNLEVKPCVLEDLTCLGPSLLTRLIKVKGIVHKKHVDLELIDSYDYIDPRTLQPEPVSGPSKPAAAAGDVISSSERGQPGAGGEQLPIAEPASPTPPAIIPLCPICGKQATEFDNMWVHCGERVR